LPNKQGGHVSAVARIILLPLLCNQGLREEKTGLVVRQLLWIDHA
jgi:hypothetical protein